MERIGKTISMDFHSNLPCWVKKHQKNHEFLYWEFCETDQIAVRQGDWKLFVEKGKCHLYNLVDDIHEDCDLAARYPDRVEDMKRIVFEQHVENPY